MRTTSYFLLAMVIMAGVMVLAPFAPGHIVRAQSGLGPTATPDAEGVIYAIVQEGDSFWSIAARHGLTLEEIYELNDAGEGDFVQVGQRIIVGYGNAPTPEATETGDEQNTTPDAETEATSTPTPPTPTPTSAPRGGEICLSAYVDENQNGQRDAGEALKGSVAFTISSGAAVVSNYVSDGSSEPYCIIGLDSGNYRVTRSTSRGEVLTTPGEWSISLADGTSETVEFGSYIDAAAASATASPDEVDESPNDESLNSVEESAAAQPDDGEGGITRIIVIAAVVVAVLLLVGVLVIVLSVRRSTI